MSTVTPAAVIVLAAGEGTRMKSKTPKVLHELAGRSLLGHALHAAAGLQPQRNAVVVRHERELVGGHAQELFPAVLLANQDDVPGTGRAVQFGLNVLDGAAQAAYALDGVSEADIGADAGQLQGNVVVLAGDIPLLDAATLQELLQTHQDANNAVTVLTTHVADPSGYGRIVRNEAGEVLSIVEHKDASPAQLQITEINSSIYVFDAGVLRGALLNVTNDNAQGEIYLTDVLRIAREQGHNVGAFVIADPMLVEGVNDRQQLAILGRELNNRILKRWMVDGVTISDPQNTWIDITVELESDVTILPGTQLHGATVVQTGAVIGPDTTLRDVQVGPGAQVTRTHALQASIGQDAKVGPFSYLRPGTVLAARGKIGAFVETKNAQIGAGSKVPHLSYVGDATIGEDSNVGAGTIFVNYDGVHKHHTAVGSNVRIGADNVLVAPVQVNDGAYTGAGTVIRREVPSGALAVSSPAQRNIDGWVDRRRPGNSSALAPQAQQELKQAEAASAAIPKPSAHLLKPPTEQDKN